MTPNPDRLTRILGAAAALAPAAQIATLGGAGAALLLPAQADAAIVQSSIQNVVVPATGDGLYMNVETGVTGSLGGSVPGWDLNPYGIDGLRWFSSASGNGVLRYPGVTTGSAGNLPFDTLVDASGSYSTSTAAVTFGANPGNWILDATNYFGFRFLAADSLTHFGWGSMILGAAATTRSIGEIWYEDTAGTGIAVGDEGGTVPEPASIALLASGAAGLLALRRRRVVH